MRRGNQRGGTLAAISRHTGREQVRYRSLGCKPTGDRVESRSVNGRSFVSASLFTRTTQQDLPPMIGAIEAPSSLSPTQFFPSASVAAGWRTIRALFLLVAKVCVGSLRKTSARMNERSCQLFAPVVELSRSGDVKETCGIGARLSREIYAMRGTILPAHAAIGPTVWHL
jgi:hypothetical protein